MNGPRDIERISAEHTDAMSRFRNRFIEIGEETKARSHALEQRHNAERQQAEQQQAERQQAEQPHTEQNPAGVTPTQLPSRPASENPGPPKPAHPAIPPTDWNEADDEFPMPKSWLV